MSRLNTAKSRYIENRSKSGSSSGSGKPHMGRLDASSRVNLLEHKQFKKARDFAYEFVDRSESKDKKKWVPPPEFINTLTNVSTQETFLKTSESQQDRLQRLKNSRMYNHSPKKALKQSHPRILTAKDKKVNDRLERLSTSKSRSKDKLQVPVIRVSTAKNDLETRKSFKNPNKILENIQTSIQENRLITDSNTSRTIKPKLSGLKKVEGGGLFKPPPKYLKSHEAPIMNLSSEYFFKEIQHYTPTKSEGKSFGSIFSASSNTFAGLYNNNINEDSIKIILEVPKPSSKDEYMEWPKVSFFAIFDSQSGLKCMKKAYDKLDTYIFEDLCFPNNPKIAILNAFARIEEEFLSEFSPPEPKKGAAPPKKKDQKTFFEESSVTLVVAIFIEELCYIANLGDCRGLLSDNCSTKVSQISRDHRPSTESERLRIISSGGYIYKEAFTSHSVVTNFKDHYKVYPGNTLVSRCLGNLNAKIPHLGGNPKICLATPEIISFVIKETYDFIILASDGVFDVLNNQEMLECIWSSTGDLLTYNMNDQSSRIVDLIMKTALVRQTRDNISVIFIGLENLKNTLFKHTYKTHSQKFEEAKLLEKTRKRVEEIKLESITMKIDEDVKFFDILQEKFKKQAKIKSAKIIRKSSISLLNNLIQFKQQEKEHTQERGNKKIFKSIKTDLNELKKNKNFRLFIKQSKEKMNNNSKSKSRSKSGEKTLLPGGLKKAPGKSKEKYVKFSKGKELEVMNTVGNIDNTNINLNTSLSLARSKSNSRANLRTAESNTSLKLKANLAGPHKTHTNLPTINRSKK